MQTEKILNDDNHPADNRLSDLPVSEGQADNAKGGVDQVSLNYSKPVFDYRPQKPSQD